MSVNDSILKNYAASVAGPAGTSAGAVLKQPPKKVGKENLSPSFFNAIVSDDSINLTWDAVDGAVSYVVERSGNPNFISGLAQVTTNGATPNALPNYDIPDPAPAIKNNTYIPDVVPVIIPVFQLGIQTDIQPTIQSSLVIFNSTLTNYQDTDVSPNTTYYYRVSCVIPGFIPQYTTISATTLPPIIATSNFYVSATTPLSLSEGKYTGGSGGLGIGVFLNWATIPGATEYTVDISTFADWSKGVMTGIYVGKENQTLINGLTTGTTYYFRVYGTAPGCNIISYAWTYIDTKKVLLPMILSVSSRTNTEIALSWADTNNIPGTIYELYMSTDSVNYTLIYNDNKFNFDVTGLIKNTIYYFKIRVTANGYVNSMFDYLSQETDGPIVAPVWFNASMIGDFTATLQFAEVNGADGYILDRCEDPSFTGETFVNVTTSDGYFGTQDTDLNPSTTYYYRVTGYRNDWTTPLPMYAYLALETRPALPTPTGLTTEILGDVGMVLQWDTPVDTDVQYTVIDIDTDPDFGSIQQTFTDGGFNVLISDLVASEEYYVRIKFIADNFNDSPYTYLPVMTNPQLAAPTNFVSILTLNDGFVLGWDNVAGAVTYTVTCFVANPYLPTGISYTGSLNQATISGLSSGETYILTVRGQSTVYSPGNVNTIELTTNS